jgi:IPT/TIG domain
MSSARRSVLALLAAALLVGGGACNKKKGLHVTGIEPQGGPYTGGTTVSITGSGFQEGSTKGVKVYFGGQQARVLGFVGDGVLKVDSPAGDAGKTVDVVLVFDDARTSEPLKYTYTEGADPLNVDSLVDGKAPPTAPPPATGSTPPPAEPTTPPAAGTTPPAAGTTPPAAGTTPPAAEPTTPPAAEPTTPPAAEPTTPPAPPN